MRKRTTATRFYAGPRGPPSWLMLGATTGTMNESQFGRGLRIRKTHIEDYTMSVPTASFVAAMKNFFGLNDKPVSDFALELKALSHEEKMQFSNMLMPHIPHTPPVKPVAK